MGIMGQRAGFVVCDTVLVTEVVWESWGRGQDLLCVTFSEVVGAKDGICCVYLYLSEYCHTADKKRIAPNILDTFEGVVFGAMSYKASLRRFKKALYRFSYFKLCLLALNLKAEQH